MEVKSTHSPLLVWQPQSFTAANTKLHEHQLRIASRLSVYNYSLFRFYTQPLYSANRLVHQTATVSTFISDLLHSWHDLLQPFALVMFEMLDRRCVFADCTHTAEAGVINQQGLLSVTELNDKL